ncbi:MAG: phospho-N-acetylmuramoyl-pentapeptide-transferase [Clostridia bacterium]|nr:phospho-N-acetylmuramoyl-pentapeptide-transferase [Clostridia bacterium]
MTGSGIFFFVFIFALSLGVTALVERTIIPILKERAEQPIYTDGPKWHASKSGTPTLGGLAFIIALLSVVPLGAVWLADTLSSDAAVSLVLTASYALLNSLIGIIDDLTKLKKKKNGGLTPFQKLAMQSVLAILLLYLRATLLGDEPTLAFSFGTVNIGIWYYPLSFLMLLGVTNCANLTDGVDGLASSVAFAIGTVLFFISSKSIGEISVISALLIGISVGFLIFNIHPAKIFMGDTGSLLLGALVGGTGLMLGNPILILLIGGVYAIEGASVILQVISYKLTGKRIFKMAPLHHHLEQSGFSENKICMLAIIATIILGIPTFLLYIS